MENKNSASKATGVETYAVGNGESYRKSGDGLEGNGSGSVEMTGQRVVTNGGEVDPEVLEHAIQALENKKTTWWAYLTTKDFWLVLLIGYVLLPVQDPRLMNMQTSACPLHHGYQHVLHSARHQGNFNPCFPDALQLHRALRNLHNLHNLPLRHEKIPQAPPSRRVEVHYPELHGRRRKLLHRPRLPLHRKFPLPLAILPSQSNITILEHPLRPTPQLLVHNMRRNCLLHPPPRPLQMGADSRDPDLLRRHGHASGLRPHHRLERRQSSDSAERRPLRARWRHVLRPL